MQLEQKERGHFILDIRHGNNEKQAGKKQPRVKVNLNMFYLKRVR